MSNLQTKQAIEHALQNFSPGQLKNSALALFEALGYRSNRRLDLDPNTAQGFIETFTLAGKLNPERARLAEWQTVEFLFQLTGDDIRQTPQLGLFTTGQVDNAIIESYLFLAVALTGQHYSRSHLAQMTREINKQFNMPVMLLFRYGSGLTMAVVNRRLHRRDETKDVLEKVTLIKDIRTAQLHRAWQQALDSSELNKRFFREVANWYFWAVERVTFPPEAHPDPQVRNATSVIRLITRLIFVWFLKEKGLIPADLFNPRQLAAMLKPGADPKGSTYYKAVLQNLFFATLNQEMNTPSRPDNRKFRGKAGQPGGRDAHYMIHNVYRYEDYFQNPQAALQLFAGIPFLNGGLFECLDKPDPADPKTRLRIDGFSDRADNPLVVPDDLFFGDEREVDLNHIYGASGKHYTVRGLINILDSYKFTVDENTPIEEEIALDPELLGKVFENLLAAYNPETGVTARKQTGSFYTPREIVNYMVDESLMAYLEAKANGESANGDKTTHSSFAHSPFEARLRHLLAYNDEPHQFSPAETARLIEAIDTIKILDPAAGSGAFPMGILHKLVFILGKLDPHNERWKEKQIEKASQIPDATFREKAIADIEEAFERNELDYGRKLYLIENCIYGVDIQPIAVQIAKLRCFISLVVDERLDETRPNRGLRPLPNLETKFVAANTLLGIERPRQMLLRNAAIDQKEAELAEVRRNHFTARTPKTKEKYRQLDQKLRTELGELLRQDGFLPGVTEKLARWDPYDQNTAADFFDPEWMFGVTEGFDVVIGNPPYLRIQNLQKTDPTAVNLYKKLYVSASKGNYDIYVVFVERGLGLLNNRGHFAYILPHKFFNAQYGEPLRGLIAKGKHLDQVIHFGHQQVFDAATTYTCLLFLDKAGHDYFRVVQVDDLEAWHTTGKALERTISSGNISASEWNFTVGEDVGLFERLSQMSVKLGDVTRIFQGLVTGADKVFVLEEVEPPKGNFIKVKDRDETEWILEQKVLRRFISHVTLSSFEQPKASHWLIFPYNLNGQGVELITDKEFSTHYPKAWNYLKQKGNTLRSREGGKWNHEQWYAFGRTQNLTQMEGSKLIVQVISLDSTTS